MFIFCVINHVHKITTPWQHQNLSLHFVLVSSAMTPHKNPFIYIIWLWEAWLEHGRVAAYFNTVCIPKCWTLESSFQKKVLVSISYYHFCNGVCWSCNSLTQCCWLESMTWTWVRLKSPISLTCDLTCMTWGKWLVTWLDLRTNFTIHLILWQRN